MSVSPASIRSIHHLTAVSANAQRTVDFYCSMLGLRLITQTVQPNELSAYHLVFAVAEHGPGVLAFDEAPGAPRGHYGIGGVHHLAFETRDRETLLQWKRWLGDNGVTVSGPYDRVYFESIYLTDPDGLILEIATYGPGWTVDEPADALGMELRLPPVGTTAGHRDEAAIAAETWHAPITTPTPEMRLRRMHHITAIASDAARIEAFYTELLGMRLVKRTVNFDNPNSPHLYFGAGAGEPGTIITYFAYGHGSMQRVTPGAGMTSHFALSVETDDEVTAWREYLQSIGVAATEFSDGSDAQVLALHDPDGQIVEIVAKANALGSEKSLSESGRMLALPAALEARRGEIERGLRPLIVPESAGRQR